MREFNIPLCYEKLPRLRKNNFQNFFKKFSIFNFRFWQNLNAPLFPQYSHDHQKFFSRILVGNLTISQFWCLFFYLHRPADLGRSIPGTVRARADRLRWSVADRRHIAQIPDIPLRRFGVLIFRHAPAMESWRTSPGVFLADLVRSRLQNFSAHKLKAITRWYCTFERVECPQRHANHTRHINTLIDIINAIICLYC